MDLLDSDLDTDSRRLERRKIVTLNAYLGRLEDQKMFAGILLFAH